MTLTYTSRLGMHRSFSSPEEVGEYEWGYGRFPREPDHEPDSGPEWQGFHDCATLEGASQMRANSYDTWVRRNCNQFTREES